MDSFEVGKKLVELCNTNKEAEGLDTLYHPDVVSIEAMEGDNQKCEGLAALKEKHAWWYANSEVHSANAKGPFPLGDRFAVVFSMDVTMKVPTEQRVQMEEVGVYTVADGKIVKEEFMYPTKM